MVNVVTNYGEFPDREKLVKGLTGQFPQVSTIVHNQNGQKSNIATGEIEKIFLGPGHNVDLCTSTWLGSRPRMRRNL